MDESSPLSAQEMLHLREANARLQAQNEQLRAEKLLLLEKLKEIKGVVFGQKRERFVPATPPNQLSLGLEAEAAAPATTVKQMVSYERAVKQAAKVAIRQPFPSHLPRVDVLIEPEEDVSGMRGPADKIVHLRSRSARKSLKN